MIKDITEALKIIVASILFAIFFGICHDLVTAHISIEYFTVGHHRVIESESPIYLALVWGVIATWWVGLILGILLSIAARVGKNPPFPLNQIIKSMLKLILIMACSALIAGILGYFLTKAGVFHLVPRLADQIQEDRHHLFLTAGWAHGASYIVGLVGGVIMCILIWRKRKSIGTSGS